VATPVRDAVDETSGGRLAGRVRCLPLLEASAAAQMAIDTGLLVDTQAVVARRYLWRPAAVSVGKFQEMSHAAEAVLAAAGLPLVRRPSGGRAVLHGSGFEWSFAVVMPAAALGFGSGAPYRVVGEAFAGALGAAGVALDPGRAAPYERSALCFSSPLRHDLLSGGDKIVAVAQAQCGGRVLVHGSVLERRPPGPLTSALEDAFGEPWRGDGLEAVVAPIAGEALWQDVLDRLGLSFEQAPKTVEVRA
jgi:lipoate-protein ligase A